MVGPLQIRRWSKFQENQAIEIDWRWFDIYKHKDTYWEYKDQRDRLQEINFHKWLDGSWFPWCLILYLLFFISFFDIVKWILGYSQKEQPSVPVCRFWGICFPFDWEICFLNLFWTNFNYAEDSRERSILLSLGVYYLLVGFFTHLWSHMGPWYDANVSEPARLFMPNS